VSVSDGRRSTTKPRRRPAEVRREQILDAAEQELLRRGLQHTTVADVAAAAGVAKGTVYLYFETKQDVLAGLRRRYVRQIEAEIRAAVDRASQAPAQLEAAVRSFVTVSTRRPDLHHLLFEEAGFDEADAFEPVRAVFSDVIESGFEFNDPDLATDYVLGGIHAAVIAMVHKHGVKRRSVDQLAALVGRTLS
jgi:AcrR family transcriptional regulator